MKILFVKYEYPELDEIGVTTLSAVLKARGHSTRLAIASRRASLERGIAWKPDIVAMSLTTIESLVCAQVGRRIRSALPGAFIVAGGAHPTCFPEYLEENPWLDAVCVGEGEGALTELAERLQRGEGVADILNLWVRTGGGIARNPLRPLVTDLDCLPFHAWRQGSRGRPCPRNTSPSKMACGVFYTI